jgi:hypothetical protein
LPPNPHACNKKVAGGRQLPSLNHSQALVGEGKTRVVHRLTHEELALLLGGIESARTQRKKRG